MRFAQQNRAFDRAGCAGNAAVEFALIIPVLLLLIIGIYEFGRAYWIQNTVQYAAEQTARCVLGKSTYSSTNPVTVDTSSSSTTCPYTVNTGGLASVTWDSTSNTAVSCFTGSKATCQKVRLTYSFTFNNLLAAMMGLVVRGSASLPTITFEGKSQVPIG
jgi:Flp pilus assembly protein TadG